MPRMGRIVLPNYPHHVVRRKENGGKYRKWGQIYLGQENKSVPNGTYLTGKGDTH